MQRGGGALEGFALAEQAARQLAADAVAQGAWANWVVVLGKGALPPDAATRKRMAEVNQSFQRLRVAVVTESTLMRAMLTALTWFDPAGSQRVTSAHGTVASAAAWMEGLAGHPLPAILAMYRAIERLDEEPLTASSPSDRHRG